MMGTLKTLATSILKKTKGILGIDSLSETYWKTKGFSLLTADATIQELEPYCIKTIPESKVDLPDIPDQNNPQNLLFKSYTFKSDPVYVWERSFRDGFISTNGSIVINKTVLRTDWDHRGFLCEAGKKDERPAKVVDTLIPLVSHHQDMSTFNSLTGYYDYVLMVGAKLSRIKDALGDQNLQDIFITYHSFGGNYEKEYMELLGFNPNNYIDSRTCKLSAEKIIFANMGTWKPNVNEILSLKRNVEKSLNISADTPSAGNRIYISRNARRAVVNEAEVIELLKKFGFIIIEDKSRTVREQIDIYRNASFIIGPHGASFANIMFCKPGTFLYELIPTSWTYDYFLYMAQINNMQYAAYRDDTHPDISNDYFNALYQDLYVSIPKLQASLENILGKL